MNILSIESSCDETACAIVRDGHDILSNVVVSQIDIFKAYGGVIPEVAARSHLEAILPIVHKALDDAFPGLPEEKQWDNIDAISVTHTPGLLGSLLIGTLTARTLAILHDKPFYPIHHLKSHIYSAWLRQKSQHLKAIGKARAITPGNLTASPVFEAKTGKTGDSNFGNIVASQRLEQENRRIGVESSFEGGAEPGRRMPLGTHPRISADKSVATDLSDAPRERMAQTDSPVFPLIALVVSGGHTQIIRMNRHNDFEIIGTTRDDAIGECFDKVAKILGLPYPGGPSISSAALGHISLQNGKTFETSPGDRQKYRLPHPKVADLDFSFSGLKTAVLRAVQSELDLPISFPSHNLPEKILSLPDPARFIADFSASFEQTAIDILLKKLSLALQKHPDTTSIIIAGGVSANTKLRKKAIKTFSGYYGAHERAIAPSACNNRPDGRDPENVLNCFFPLTSFSGDNAAMVASATYYEIKSGVPPTDPYSLTLLPRSPIF